MNAEIKVGAKSYFINFKKYIVNLSNKYITLFLRISGITKFIGL